MGRKAFFILLFASLWFSTAHALRFSVRATTPFVYVQIGHGDLSSYGLLGPPASLIDEVAFTFPAGVQSGDGTPVAGTPVIPIAFLGYSGRNRSIYRITIDSSAGLTNINGDSMPFSEFSWVTQDGDIPAGQFNNSPNQLLFQYSQRGRRRARGIVDYLSFSYANTQIYPAGVYTGRVFFTITEL
ncbi:MAG: hypothetical protein JSV45_13095 [Chromatiales bacterium]|nr:MAG: hypothetical protein JSV45_13095 [Chromatiales bacterium]